MCSYIDDVYRVAEMLELQKDVKIIKRQDYMVFIQLYEGGRRKLSFLP